MLAEDLRVHGELVASGELAKVTLPGKARFLEWRSSTFKNAARLWQLIERHGGLPKKDRSRMQRVDVGWQERPVARGWRHPAF